MDTIAQIICQASERNKDSPDFQKIIGNSWVKRGAVVTGEAAKVMTTHVRSATAVQG